MSKILVTSQGLCGKLEFHLGHMWSVVYRLSDIFKVYANDGTRGFVYIFMERMNMVQLLEVEALKAGMDVQSYCDMNHARHAKHIRILICLLIFLDVHQLLQRMTIILFLNG